MKLHVQYIFASIPYDLFPRFAELIGQYKIHCEIVGKGTDETNGVVRISYLKDLIPLHTKGVDELILLFERYFKYEKVPDNLIPERISKMIRVEDSIQDVPDEEANTLINKLKNLK